MRQRARQLGIALHAVQGSGPGARVTHADLDARVAGSGGTAKVRTGRLAAAAREGRATRDELSGSTITVTSLGALGGVATTPVINYPEVAIVGVNRIAERPVVRGGQVVVRKMMNLSCSFDHRLIDGWNAAEFVHRIKAFLEQPAALFVE